MAGKTLYTWCALDALSLPQGLGIRARIESPCPATGQLVVIDVDGERLGSVSPDTAVISMLGPSVFGQDADPRAV